MKKIILRKGSGKTDTLISISASTEQHIVCHTRNCHSILLRAKELGLEIPMPISYDEFLNKKYMGRDIKGFLIDDADVLLQYITHVQVSYITMTV